HKSKEKNIRLQTKITDSENEYCWINAPLLEQALINLIDNAIKYSETSSEINIHYHMEKNHFKIAVEDQGPGIHHSHIPRIFERFYVVDKARNIKQGGTGLGLSIVKYIAQLHKGDVTVQSTPGQGSSFDLIIPR
ncbi:MAG: ATP-binding protein, partial [Halobacteriovoraceae bacterium]|nr:ATP-binding protein [Halobacteriovoraceae bacterium]